MSLPSDAAGAPAPSAAGSESAASEWPDTLSGDLLWSDSLGPVGPSEAPLAPSGPDRGASSADRSSAPLPSALLDADLDTLPTIPRVDTLPGELLFRDRVEPDLPTVAFDLTIDSDFGVQTAAELDRTDPLQVPLNPAAPAVSVAQPPRPDSLSDTLPMATRIDDIEVTPLANGVTDLTGEHPLSGVPPEVLAAFTRTDPSMDFSPQPWRDRRVLVVSGDAQERMYLRARLALSRLSWMDEATSTTQALAAMDGRPYLLAFVNLDSAVIDAELITRRFKADNPGGTLVFTTDALGDVPVWDLVGQLRHWRLQRQLGGSVAAEVMPKPLEPRRLAQFLTRFTLQKLA